MQRRPIMSNGLDAIVRDAMAVIGARDPQWIEIPTLLRADTLLDLYGEDIRNRAYIVHDPIEGDMMLRPDFTLPVLEAHIAAGAAEGRYAYSGRVWRKRRETARNDRSFWQLGFERFDLTSGVDADAEIFALARELALPFDLQAKTGDLGLIFAALDLMDMADYRRAALKRHIWRPRAFERLLARYSLPVSAKSPRKAQMDSVVIGLRSGAMIAARLERLAIEAAMPPLAETEVEMLNAILAIKGTLASAGRDLGAIARRFGMETAIADGLIARADALSAHRVDPAAIAFDAGYGRTSMEYYDGAVFGWFRDGVAAPVLTGGRYDRLTGVVGAQARAAIGVAFRPELAKGAP